MTRLTAKCDVNTGAARGIGLAFAQAYMCKDGVCCPEQGRPVARQSYNVDGLQWMS